MCEQYEVRFYHQQKPFGGAIVSKRKMERGYLEDMFFVYLDVPWLNGKIVNAHVKPIKKDIMDLDFTKERLLVEV